MDPSYFRTSDGHEIDLVFERAGETWAIEVKLTGNPSPHDMDRLNRAADLIGADRRVLVSQVGAPSLGDQQASCGLPDLLSLLGANRRPRTRRP